MSNFIYKDSLCGAGKTHFLAKNVIPHITNKKDKRNVIASPSILLSTQTENYFHEWQAIRIDSSTIDKSQNVSTHLKLEMDIKKQHDVVLTTHESIINLAKENKDTQKYYDYVLHIDEEVGIYDMLTLNLSKNKLWIDDKIQIKNKVKNTDYIEIEPTEEFKKYQRYRKTDQIINSTTELYDKINDKRFKTFVKSNDLNLFKAGKISTLNFFFLLDLDIFNCFHEVIFYSAFADQTFFMLATKYFGITKQEFSKAYPNIKDTTRYDSHKNTTKTKIHYYRDNQISKYAYATAPTFNDKPIFDNCFNHFVETIKDEKALFIGNKSTNDELNTKKLTNHLYQNIEIISSKSHGLNQYQDIHKVYFAAALRINNQVLDFMNEVLEINEESADFAFNVQTAYQSILRCSIRNPDDDSERDIYVSDYHLAVEIAGILNIKIDELIDETVHSQEIIEDWRFTRDMIKKDSKALVQKFMNRMSKESDYLKDLVLDDGCKFQINILDSIRSTKVVDTFNYRNTKELFDFFEGHDKFVSDDKHAPNRLVFPVVFDPDASSTTTFGKDNVLSASCIMLDKDKSTHGKDLTKETATEILKEMGLNHIIYDTHSENGNFRILIPLTHMITPDVYEAALQSINNRFYRKGYNEKKDSFGPFDGSKLNSSSKFYLPNHPKNSKAKLIRVDDLEDLDPKKFFKDKKNKIPTEFLKKTSEYRSLTSNRVEQHIYIPIQSNFNHKTREEKIEEAKQTFLSNPSNNSCLKLIRSLYYFGVPEQETKNFINSYYHPKKSKTNYDTTVSSWYRRANGYRYKKQETYKF